MATQKQIAANKRNAKLSTGPRTELGRARSRYNALSHGLTAKVALIKGEDPAEFDSFFLGLRETYQPTTVIEDALVERAATLFWRLKRLPVLEGAFLELMAFEQDHIDKRERTGDGEKSVDFEFGLLGDEKTHETRSERIFEYPIHSKTENAGGHQRRMEALRIARALLRNWHYSDVFERLGRHERHLARQFELTLRELERLTAKRTEVDTG